LQAAVQKVSERIRQKQENLRMKQLVHNISQPGNPRIGLPTGDRIEYVDVHKIVHCRGEGNYTHIYYEEKKHLLVAKTLVEFEDMLNDYNFIRIHKSHLVNLKHVVAYIKTDGGMLQLSNGDKVVISRRRKETVQQQLKHGIR
jgi:two-component system LytT family response regulator